MAIQRDLEKVAGITDPTTRRLAFLALFSGEYCRRNGGRYPVPVLVGGMAVELYTQGHYSTHDVDLLCKDERAGEILLEWGFERLPAKRQFYSESLDIALEILGNRLVNEDPDAEARTEFVLFEGLGEGSPDRICVIALEDLILYRLNAAVHWKSGEDRLWAEIMLDLGLSSEALGLNLDYLRKKAGEKGYETGEMPGGNPVEDRVRKEGGLPVEIRYESLRKENKKLRKRVASLKATAGETGEIFRKRTRSEEKKALLKHAVKTKVRFRRSAEGELVIRLKP